MSVPLRWPLFLAGVLLTAVPAKADVNVKACAPEPEVTDIAYGDLVNCEITPVGDSDLFRFSGQAGDVIEIYLMRASGGADQFFRLITPDNTPGNYVGDSFWRPATVAQTVTLSKSGSYTIQVVDGGSDESYRYSLALFRLLPLPATAVPITFGRILSGEINPRGDTDLYTFAGVVGDLISITVSRTSGGADHFFRVIAPDGSIGGYKGDSFWRPAAVAMDYKVAKAGVHVIQIVDGAVDESFPYNIDVQCIGSCIPPPPCPVPPTYTLSPPSQVLPAAAGTGAIGVYTSPGCPWSASSDSSYLSITSGASGAGPGTIQFSLAANTGAAPRTGVITVANQRATVTQSGTAPLLVVSPSPLALTFREGAKEPGEQVISVFTNAASLPFTAVASTSSGGNWLSVNTSAGTAPASIVATVDPTAVPPGTYSGSIVVSAPTANPSSRTVGVTLRIESAGPPRLGVDSDTLILSFAQGAQARVERRNVSNLGGGSLPFTIDARTLSGEDWLQVTPDSGEATIGSPATLAVRVDPGRLSPGTYSARISVTGAGETRGLPVVVTVSAVQQTILLSQSGLTFTAVSGGGAVPPQSFGVLNTGQSVMDWSVSATTAKANWLSVTPSSGTTDGGSLSVPLVDVSVDATGLAPGEYYGRVKVEAAAADNSPQFVAVVLTVLPPGSDPGPLVRPTGLIFTGRAGAGNPASQTVRVANLTSAPRTFASGRLTIDGASWFTSTPAGAAVRPGQPLDIQVQPNTGALGPGIRRGVLTLLFQDGSVANVNILFVLSASAPAAQIMSAEQPRADDGVCSPTTLLPVITSIGSNFTAPVTWPNPIEARIIDDCGSPMLDGSVVATFSNGDPPVPLVSLKDGRWMRTWIPRNSSAAQVTVTVSAEIPERQLRGSAQVSGALRSNPEPPVLSPGGIVNAISFQAEPLAPGALVTIYGSKLKSEAAKASDVLALIGGRVMPVLSATDKQINAVIPYGIPTDTRHQLIVQNGDTYTNPETVTIAAAQPAIPTKDQSGKGQGAIADPNGALYEPGHPAQAGSDLILFCAGLGDVDPKVDAGKPAPDSPLLKVARTVSLTIGGVEARVSSAVLAPSLVGVYQVNATVPEGVQAGDAVPVVLTVAGQSSPAVTMAVQ